MAINNKNIALLIDAENISSNSIKSIISELKKFGNISIKMIYADWSDIKTHSWKDAINIYALETIHKFAYSSKKILAILF